MTPRVALLEAGRRSRLAFARRRERAMLAKGVGVAAPARLGDAFARMSAPELLEHFRRGGASKFFAGFDEVADAPDPAALGARLAGADETVRQAEEITRGRWSLLGYGAFDFGEAPDWLRDPVSGVRWERRYHADVPTIRGDGSDIRVVWELNRLAHLLTLARAYALTREGRFAAACLRHVRDWRAHNPVGFGPNWACAMEVALRAMNLLAAFRLLCRAPELGGAELSMMLATFDEHGAHVRRNLEFSYLMTSNHYLSDVVGLFWLGACLPELREARAWREFGLREALGEMDKQVLDDGADAEASTGYHRFVTELFLYSFLLARANGIEIGDRYRRRLRAMLAYSRAVLRPAGRAPLVGDADSGQVMPVRGRAADEHAHLLALGAVLFDEPLWKVEREAPAEVFWLLGGAGARKYEEIAADSLSPHSQAFERAGSFVLREGDLYLLLSASGAGLGGRGSHAHNDALSIEVSACGASFIRDPGSYVYTSDLRARHLFRSTAYHSTVEIDGAEQSTIREELPFNIGDEARPRHLRWESDGGRDLVVAEHGGYARLRAGAITHRRAVVFDRRARLWLVEDSFRGAGEHEFRFFFHLAPGAEARVADGSAEVCDRISGARLFIVSTDAPQVSPTLEPRWSSTDYGAREKSETVCWTLRAAAPFRARWALVPVRAGESDEERLSLIERSTRGGVAG
ncbi:MAG TPA: alginate lyase family protein [Pyrinomonadaceae bacterium]|nr:alginate lyase family protein [Pyrinomonadaceae bacterium]